MEKTQVKPLKLAKHDNTINSILGSGTVVEGNIDAAGFTRVDGSLKGDLSVKGRVIIGERARMKSCVTGTSVTIGGVVVGDVLASERLVILSTGLVVGDIITRRIKADDGCLIHGKVTICESEEKWASAVAEYRDAAMVRERI
jgi:cytoskeletal protein CcmA (bactofilin family)